MSYKTTSIMESIEQKAKNYVANRWPQLRDELKQAAIRGYIDGYKSAPQPIIQLELKFTNIILK